jgi:hypothetical protein
MSLLEEAKAIENEVRDHPSAWPAKFLVNACPDCGAKAGQRCGFTSDGEFIEMNCMLHYARIS